MERVQFQQEQMLAELKDLEQKGLFTQAEIKSIMKKRTAFESALVRRVPKKGDFLRYAAYEMGLEALRRRRVTRLNLPPGPPSISDYALVRRQFHIFERALRKFKADVALWVQYIEVARREGARALVGRISARALQLHPNEAALYVFAAQHEVENLSPAAARALLQRGIRLNKEDVSLWTEYVKFELGFVEGLRRRWDVLGVNGADAMEDGSEEARREIMQGSIVKTVIDGAAKAIARLPLFQALHTLLSTYPTPLREDLLEHVHTLLVRTLPTDPAALKLHAARLLPASAGDDESFVDKLQAANEELLEQARTHGGGISAAYAEFVEEWWQRNLDANLRMYLISCLQSIAALENVAPRVLATHVRLLSSDGHPSPPGPAKIAQRARKYTERSGSAEVWLARLEAEGRVRGAADVRRVWDLARRRAEGEGVEEVWMWGLRDAGADAKDICECLLRESMGASTLHTAVLVHYVTRILHAADGLPAAETRVANTRRVLRMYLATPAFFRAAFLHETTLEAPAEAVLEELYRGWRERAGEEMEACVTWARWLVEAGDGARAAAVVAGTAGAELWW